MSEQQAEQSGHETGSLGAGSAVPNSSDPRIDCLMTSEQAARSVESPKIVPDQDEAAKADDKAFELGAETIKAAMPKAEPFTVAGFKVDAPKPDTLKPDTLKPDTLKGDAPQADGPKADALENDGPNPDTPRMDAAGPGATRLARELLIMSPGEGTWERSEEGFESGNAAPKPDKEMPTRGRRFAAMAAMLLLAVIAGAAGGAFATLRLSPLTETTAVVAPNIAALEASVGRIDSDIVALKARLERTTSEGFTQFNKTSERLERIEKAQAEPAAKLAKLSDAVDKLRATASVATTPVATVAPKDITGTVTTPVGAQALPTSQPHAPPAVAAAVSAPTTEVGRLPTIEGWVLRDVSHGLALIEGRIGLYEVAAGDSVPGLGLVEVIRKQDGRWVVVTPKGLIVALIALGICLKTVAMPIILAMSFALIAPKLTIDYIADRSLWKKS